MSSPGGAPEVASAAQSVAQQDLDRKLKALAEEHDAQMQVLTTALAAQRQALLMEGKSDPAVSAPERSAGSSSAGTWEKVNDPSAPKDGSSSASQGAPPSEQASAKPPPLPPPKASGLFTGTEPTQSHSWE